MSRRILLHICCGPCAIAPVLRLKEAGFAVTGLFYNPNIQPVMEYLRRRDTLAAVAARLDVEVLHDDYDPMAHLRRSLADPDGRCPPCLDERLARTAAAARRLEYDAFSTSLLYSKYQDHEAIKNLGQAQAEASGVSFHYRDFRLDWDEGVAASREWGLYRQPYCGCILSEFDRYAKKLRTASVVG